MSYADASVRATSLMASAALLGAATLIALTASLSTVLIEPPTRAPAPVVTITPEIEPPPPPPEPVRQVQTSFDPVTPIDVPMLPTDLTAPLEPTDIPVSFVQPGPVEISNPHWTRVPRDLARYYPSRALSREVEGAVVLDCLVGTTGALSCSVVSETPPNWGFGAAALDISRAYRMSPATRNGVPVEGRHRMRVPFELR